MGDFGLVRHKHLSHDRPLLEQLLHLVELFDGDELEHQKFAGVDMRSRTQRHRIGQTERQVVCGFAESRARSADQLVLLVFDRFGDLGHLFAEQAAGSIHAGKRAGRHKVFVIYAGLAVGEIRYRC